MRSVWMLGACLAAGTSVATADPLNLYLGTGLGYATVQESFTAVDVVQHPVGWKLFAGWRPIQMFAAELDYVDLGSRDAVAGFNAQSASARAVAAFAIGYLPQPFPWLDFYGKVGLARLRTDISNTLNAPCNAIPGCFGTVGESRTSARFAYGAGVQVKLGTELVRLEYQGFSTPGGDQSLLSLDAAFSF